MRNSSFIMSQGGARVNPFQIRRVASQTKPLQQCHPERSEGSLSGERSFAALRMTKREGLFFEMYLPLVVARRAIPSAISPAPAHLQTLARFQTAPSDL